MAKVNFKNGSSIELPDEDSPEAGRGVRPFEPHPCQEFEIEVAGVVTKHNLKEIEKSWLNRARSSSTPISYSEHVLGYAFKPFQDVYLSLSNREDYLNQIRSAISEYKEDVKKNNDCFAAAAFLQFDVPLRFSVAVFKTLRKEGLNVSTAGERFGCLRMQILILPKNIS